MCVHGEARVWCWVFSLLLFILSFEAQSLMEPRTCLARLVDQWALRIHICLPTPALGHQAGKTILGFFVIAWDSNSGLPWPSGHLTDQSSPQPCQCFWGVSFVLVLIITGSALLPAYVFIFVSKGREWQSEGRHSTRMRIWFGGVSS